jgi:bifunctional UDP-N-acetylglucosamine pyrophosphorylase/glucosamine-1-phosphate N-acetyltransferase
MMEIDELIRLAKCHQLMNDGREYSLPSNVRDRFRRRGRARHNDRAFVQLLGNTRVGSDTRIRSYCVIRNTQIGDGVNVLPGCVMDDSHVEDKAIVGPVFAPATGK